MNELSGTWRAAVADQELRLRFQEPDHDDDGWESIEVPGHWRTTEAFADHDGPILYRRHVSIAPAGPDERMWLIADGVFSEADVWWNGHYLGDMEGYFAPHAFELGTDVLDRDDHVVAVEVSHRRADDLDAKHSIVGIFDDSRDVDPAWNPGGIWRPITIDRSGPARIAALRARCRTATPDEATLVITASVNSDRTVPAEIETTIAGTEHRFEHPLSIGDNRVEWTVTIPEPALWWPHGHGDQPLHDLRVELSVDGRVSHERTVRTGLRAVAMRHWRLHVNGQVLFAKGANIGPTRLDLGATTAAQVECDISTALDANLNLLRVRGHIGHPTLYETADRLGMLLWQDFPLHRGYSRRVRRRAIDLAEAAVDTLAHHPSIVIWCAHNSPVPEGAPHVDGRPRFGGPRAAMGQQLPTWNKSVLDRSVKRTIDKADGTRPVIAHSGLWPHPPQLDGTDTHLWFGWRWGDERDLARLSRRMPRAVRWVSELGAASVPTSAEFCEPERWPDLDWDRLAEHHGYEPGPFARNVPPEMSPTFDHWRDTSQRYQAQLLRRQIETLRRIKYRPTGGFCLHFFADAAPAISSSLLDHERNPKAALAAVREACAPVIVVADRLPRTMVADESIALDVHVVSDHRHDTHGTVVADLTWPGGSHQWRWSGPIEADAVTRVGTLSWVAPAVTGPATLELGLHGDDTASNRYDTTITS